MSSGYRCVFCLCIALASGQVLGQDDDQRSPAAQPSNAAGDTSPTPFPITIVESEDAAAHAQEREEKADNHDAADLLAQQEAAAAAKRSADATEGQLQPVTWQAWLAAVGAILAAIALVLSGATAIITIGNSRRELRAYMVLKEPRFRINNTAGTISFSAFAAVRNAGHTPANDVRIYVDWVVSDLPGGAVPTPEPPTEQTGSGAPIGPGIDAESRAGRLSLQDVLDASFQRKRLYFFVRIEYLDIWGKPHSTWLCYRTHPEFKPQDITVDNFRTFQMNWSCPNWGENGSN